MMLTLEVSLPITNELTDNWIHITTVDKSRPADKKMGVFEDIGAINGPK